MSFADHCPQVETTYRVTGSLVQIGGTTWQLRNITSVRIVSELLSLDEAEPRFIEQRPRRTFRTGVFMLMAAIAFLLALQTSHLWGVFLLLTALSACAVFALGHYANVNAVNEWMKAKARTERRATVWKVFAARRHAVHSLVFDTSSGQSVALAVLDLGPLEALQEAILQAMSTSAGEVDGKIRIVDPTRKKPKDALADYFERLVAAA